MPSDVAERSAPSDLFLNRELSWLAFNRRVLEEAQDPGNPLLERVKFLSIVDSNLSEFVEIRVAGLRQQEEAGITAREPDGMTPAEALIAIDRVSREQVDDLYRCWNEQLRPALEKEGVVFQHPERVARGAAGLAARVLPPRDLPGVDADRARPRPSVSVRRERQPQHRGAAPHR